MTGEVISIVRNIPPIEPADSPASEKGKSWVTLAEMCKRYSLKESLPARLIAEGFNEHSLGAKMAQGRATRLMFDIESLLGKVERLREQVRLHEGDARDARIAELEAENAALRRNHSDRINGLSGDISRLFNRV